MTTFSFQPNVLGNFIGGEFRLPADASGQWKILSPADLDDLVGEFQYGYADVDLAVGAASEAARTWRKTSIDERKQLLLKYKEALDRREDELAQTIARETGKPLWEAKTEVGAMKGKVDITNNQSLQLVADSVVDDILPGVAGATRYRPLGVAAVIGPFNFPGHLANGHIVPALATGNTVVFKPSEKTPLTGQVMAECFAEAGFPAGVFNLLHGEKEVGRRLVTHEDVDAVLFTGSYEVGTRIKQDTLLHHWKLLALEMGGKNASIVWKDADLETAVRDTMVGGFLTTGQRCSSTSRVLVHEDIADEYVARIHEASKKFKIGHPLDEVFMGPLIDAQSVDRYLKFQGIAKREGAEEIMRGKALETTHRGHYVTPSLARMPTLSLEDMKKSVYMQSEIFAPNIAIMGVRELDEAVALSNATQYGLVTSIFTQSRDVYVKALEDLETGLVNWNRPTPGASSKLPFGGTRKSGNHWPTALPSVRYCTYPVASLEAAKPGDAKYVGLE
jgi:succinylglutamic semialdehyde dehydrogenase